MSRGDLIGLFLPVRRGFDHGPRQASTSRFMFCGRPPTNLEVLWCTPVNHFIGGDRISVTTGNARANATPSATEMGDRTRKSITLDLDLDIHRSPDSVRAWWTDLPDEYVAKDPREQPHRIRALARQGDRVEVVGTWRGPLGREMLLKETLRLREDGSWTFDSRAMGISVHDEFEVVSLGEGARLHIRSVLTPARPLGRLVARLMGRRLVRRMAESWRTAALICERDAP